MRTTSVKRMDWMRAAYCVNVFSVRNEVTGANISQRNREPIIQPDRDVCISMGYRT